MGEAQQTLDFGEEDEKQQELSPAASSVFSLNVLEMTVDLCANTPGSPLEDWLDEQWEGLDRAQKDGIYRLHPRQ
jgi:hypothetical protein